VYEQRSSAVARRSKGATDEEVDANSCGEVGRRQRLAELITVEKNRCILVTGPKAQSRRF